MDKKTYKRKNFIGKRFSRMVVLADRKDVVYPSGKKQRRVLCGCDCGNKKEVLLSKLLNGETKSCTCYQKEMISKANSTHKMSKTPEYLAWMEMKKRCYNKKDKRYSDYGGRGISICDRWMTFQNFIADIGKRPTNGHSIDRKNNEGDYCPVNCRWATAMTQQNNKRTNVRVTYKGQTKTLAQWARSAGINYQVFYWRYKHWKNFERILYS